MKKRLFALLVIACMVIGVFCGCESSAPAASDENTAASASEAEAVESVAEAAPAPEAVSAAASADETAPSAPESVAEEEASAAEEPSAAEEIPEEAPAGPATITFSTGEVYEATIGEDFVFFFQCDAPGDMGEPEAGEEGAGISVSEGTVTYSDVGTGGPYSYPTSEKVIISGFTGDITVTVCEAATNMDATHTIYTDPQEIEDAIAFNAKMAAERANNPMPGGQ